MWSVTAAAGRPGLQVKGANSSGGSCAPGAGLGLGLEALEPELELFVFVVLM